MADKKYYLKHERGCGKTAYFFSRKPISGEVITTELAVNVDGSKPLEDEKMICGSCNEIIRIFDLGMENIYECEDA